VSKIESDAELAAMNAPVPEELRKAAIAAAYITGNNQVICWSEKKQSLVVVSTTAYIISSDLRWVAGTVVYENAVKEIEGSHEAP